MKSFTNLIRRPNSVADRSAHFSCHSEEYNELEKEKQKKLVQQGRRQNM